jgi:hypothetical protein
MKELTDSKAAVIVGMATAVSEDLLEKKIREQTSVVEVQEKRIAFLHDALRHAGKDGKIPSPVFSAGSSRVTIIVDAEDKVSQEMLDYLAFVLKERKAEPEGLFSVAPPEAATDVVCDFAGRKQVPYYRVNPLSARATEVLFARQNYDKSKGRGRRVADHSNFTPEQNACWAWLEKIRSWNRMWSNDDARRVTLPNGLKLDYIGPEEKKKQQPKGLLASEVDQRKLFELLKEKFEGRVSDGGIPPPSPSVVSGGSRQPPKQEAGLAFKPRKILGVYADASSKLNSWNRERNEVKIIQASTPGWEWAAYTVTNLESLAEYLHCDSVKDLVESYAQSTPDSAYRLELDEEFRRMAGDSHNIVKEVADDLRRLYGIIPPAVRIPDSDDEDDPEETPEDLPPVATPSGSKTREEEAVSANERLRNADAIGHVECVDWDTVCHPTLCPAIPILHGGEPVDLPARPVTPERWDSLEPAALLPVEALPPGASPRNFIRWGGMLFWNTDKDDQGNAPIMCEAVFSQAPNTVNMAVSHLGSWYVNTTHHIGVPTNIAGLPYVRRDRKDRAAVEAANAKSRRLNEGMDMYNSHIDVVDIIARRVELLKRTPPPPPGQAGKGQQKAKPAQQGKPPVKTGSAPKGTEKSKKTKAKPKEVSDENPLNLKGFTPYKERSEKQPRASLLSDDQRATLLSFFQKGFTPPTADEYASLSKQEKSAVSKMMSIPRWAIASVLADPTNLNRVLRGEITKDSGPPKRQETPSDQQDAGRAWAKIRDRFKGVGYFSNPLTPREKALAAAVASLREKFPGSPALPKPRKRVGGKDSGSGGGKGSPKSTDPLANLLGGSKALDINQLINIMLIKSLAGT